MRSAWSFLFAPRRFDCRCVAFTNGTAPVKIVNQSTANRTLFHLCTVDEMRASIANRDEGADRNGWLYSYNPLTVKLVLIVPVEDITAESLRPGRTSLLRQLLIFNFYAARLRRLSNHCTSSSKSTALKNSSRLR
jgi:hypothetical protein